MHLRSTFIAASALLAGGFTGHAAPQTQTIAGRPVLWTVHFDAERLRTGVGQGLFTNLDPILTALSGNKSTNPGGKLESAAIFGFEPAKKSRGDFPFLASASFTAEGGGISQRFEAISKKNGVPIEDLTGTPVIHFNHRDKEVWIAKPNDQLVLITASRSLLESVLKAGTGVLASSFAQIPNEVLGGNVEIKSLLAGNPDLGDSELLKLLPHLDFHLVAQGERLNLDASAELENERAAKRAARMIDGMVAMMAMHDKSGVPWDERLDLNQEGSNLALHLHLEPGEAKKLFDTFAREVDAKIHHDNDDE